MKRLNHSDLGTSIRWGTAGYLIYELIKIFAR